MHIYVWKSNPHSRRYFDMRVLTLGLAVDNEEGMKQENEFQRIALISLRSPMLSASGFGKLLSR